MKTNMRALYFSTVLTMILIVFLTIYSELNEVFKNFLKTLSGHHWVSKGIISLLFFVLCYALLHSRVKEDDKKLHHEINNTIIIAILGALTILGFFLYEFFI